MTTDFLLLPGGLGLFLLGMVILTQGLREMAGGPLRRLLVRFTRTPLRGAAAGALATAIVQSSSATTVTAVGFVGAGLLTFPQGLGIVFGANIGTTITGWLVAILGFKLNLGLAVLPLVLVGVLLRLFASRRMAQAGWAMIGFSLLFVGIDAMQQGMAQFEGVVTPADFPDDTLAGRLQLVAIGILITLVTQSSSAGVAAALVAQAAGTISFPQAAAMVIGMDVGTTVTAALATIGGSTATRRTGYAHVIYNVFAATIAFFLLDLYTQAIDALVSGGAAGNAQIALVGFHTTFNVVGVTLLLPFAAPFARLIARLVPERGPPLLRRLDTRLLRDPSAAVDATVATVRDISDLLAGHVADRLARQGQGGGQSDRRAADEAIEATRGFIEQVRTEPANPRAHSRHLAAMHALDHLRRLSFRCAQDARIAVLGSEHRLRRLSGLLRQVASTVVGNADSDAVEARLDRLRSLLRRQHHHYRELVVAAAAEQRVSADDTLLRLDGVRWLQRVAYHLWRIAHHLRHAEEEAMAEAEPAQLVLEHEED